MHIENAHRAPARIVTLALAHEIIDEEEMGIPRNLEDHDAWFREIGARLDASRHLPQDRDRRVQLREALDVYFAGRRAGRRCGL